MMTNRQTIGLKGQHNLAQGKQSGALGWKTDMKIVRAVFFFEWLSLFRTKRHESQFRPKNIFTLINVFARTGSSLFLFPQALPGARINWPFRPEFVYKE